MSSYLKKLKRHVCASKPKNGAKMTHAFMRYTCQDCQSEINMYLEEGLEEHGENHKPVPFGIRCPECGGFHCYDSSAIIPLFELRPIYQREHYFKNDPRYDCGVPVHPQRRNKND